MWLTKSRFSIKSFTGTMLGCMCSMLLLVSGWLRSVPELPTRTVQVLASIAVLPAAIFQLRKLRRAT